MAGLIVVAGVPGTGKSIIGSRLACSTGYRFTTVSWLALEHGVWNGYDVLRRSFVLNGDALCRLLEGLKGRWIVETHWLGFLAECRGVEVERVVVTRCRPSVLWRRLRRRSWPLRKVVENVEAEFLGVVAYEALELFDELVEEVETSGLGKRGKCCIDWSLFENEVEFVSRLALYTGEELAGVQGA